MFQVFSTWQDVFGGGFWAQNLGRVKSGWGVKVLTKVYMHRLSTMRGKQKNRLCIPTFLSQVGRLAAAFDFQT